ncbi:hypothetical protein GQ37_012985 [Janthinobacterium sp. BJB1]|nr:hypothetical protein GQ37_012985 [Janthinobacterium sp. BJB1]
MAEIPAVQLHARQAAGPAWLKRSACYGAGEDDTAGALAFTPWIKPSEKSSHAPETSHRQAAKASSFRLFFLKPEMSRAAPAAKNRGATIYMQSLPMMTLLMFIKSQTQHDSAAS